MVLLTRKTRFSAAHRYYLDHFSEKENLYLFGRCTSAHGHDYLAEVTVAGSVSPRHGMVVNISDLKRILEAEIVRPLDGQYLTPHHPLLEGLMPSTEVLAQVIWKRVEPALAEADLAVRLERVLLAESRRLWSECRRGRKGLMVTLTRTYEFAAAHRLHSPKLTEAENQAVFGKCSSPHGHGHNYVLEVTVGGDPDPQTGLLIELGLLDRVVHEQVVDRYDHRHLNFDVEEFRELNPTAENLVQVIWKRLEPLLPPGALRRVTIRETERNVFTCEGDRE